MSIPTYQEIMRPLLEYAAQEQEKEMALEAVRAALVAHFQKHPDFQLTEEELQSRLSGGERVFFNRIRWALNDLKRANLLQSPRRAFFEITPRGVQAVDSGETIDRKYLMRFDEHRVWVEESTAKSRQSGQPEEEKEKPSLEAEDDLQTPDEKIDMALRRINNDVAKELLNLTRKISPERFEQLAVDLLLAMKYGVSGERTGGRGDGGIDGIINEDALGFRQIGIQAKCWSEDNKVTGDRVNAFSGALGRKGMEKGIFVTTSSFTPDAERAVQEVANRSRIIPIDGWRLANLMLDFGVGCNSKPLVRKEIDEDFWSAQD